MINTPQKAIEQALAQNWDSAISINEELLKNNQEDIEILCRLGYAYLQQGKLEKSKKIYRKILSLDHYNAIAAKNLDKLLTIAKSTKKNRDSVSSSVTPSQFLEEPGKTKTIALTNVAPKSVISKLNIGNIVSLFAKKHTIEVRRNGKEYLGALPDDTAFRLLRFISAGNTYLVIIKNIQKNAVSVFIRELSRGRKFRNQPTFLPLSLREFSVSTIKEIKKSGPEESEEPGDQDALEE